MENKTLMVSQEDLAAMTEFLMCIVKSKHDVLNEFGYDKNGKEKLAYLITKYDTLLLIQNEIKNTITEGIL